MAEITDDLKIDLLEISQSNGINLTSESTRIKHTKNGQFAITSNGIINISTGDGILNNNDLQINGNINIFTKNADNTMDEELSINIVGGDGSSEFEGSYINIKGGNGLQGANSSGGGVDIFGGRGEGTGDGGEVRIASGSNLNGSAGNLYLEGGLSKYNSDGITGNPGGNIIIQSGYGGEKCGDVNIFTGQTILGPSFGPTGRVKIMNGAFKLAIFTNSDERDDRIPIPEKGDMCFVADKINVHNGTAWRTISFDT
jgi:hypothetical protein